MLKTTTSVINASQISGVLPVINGGTGVTTSTGTGSTVLSTSPTIATPILGVASATSVNKVAITAPATGATLTIAEGKTLTANHSLTLAGTDATTMTFPTTSATVARTDAANSFTGDQTLSTGNLIQGTTAKGINFTANTPAAGMTSQLLNWYEEGTFTPTIIGLTIAGVGTYTTQEGFYTKIGRLVTFQLSITITGHTGTGGMRINGLPINPSGTLGPPRPFSVTYSNFTYTSQPQAFGVATTSQVYLREAVSGTAYTDIPMDTSCSISVSGSYIV